MVYNDAILLHEPMVYNDAILVHEPIVYSDAILMHGMVLSSSIIRFSSPLWFGMEYHIQLNTLEIEMLVDI